MSDIVDEVINEEIVRLQGKISQTEQQIYSALKNRNNITGKEAKNTFNQELKEFY